MLKLFDKKLNIRIRLSQLAHLEVGDRPKKTTTTIHNFNSTNFTKSPSDPQRTTDNSQLTINNNSTSIMSYHKVCLFKPEFTRCLCFAITIPASALKGIASLFQIQCEDRQTHDNKILKCTGYLELQRLSHFISFSN
ncbi:unnamed protein product [Ambrosiozyma monospora]|uniref:Unnamed protein product n=1 Tax=Ambrosiozyma monospora TaxID=43982 RepID=A0A9W6Z4S7_AMBMO|nr:unnamed protein product [Ambrosiozyma monospora]